MKKQTSVLMGAVLALGLFTTTASADIKKGQQLYLKKCRSCHGNGTKGSAMHTQMEWKHLFENDAASIIEKHKGTEGEELFNSPKFQKLAPHLKDFLYYYGSDSGNVPSCG